MVGCGRDVHQKPSPCLGVPKESAEEDLDLGIVQGNEGMDGCPSTLLVVMAMLSQMDRPQLFHVHEMPGHGGGMTVPRAHGSGDDQRVTYNFQFGLGWKWCGKF